MKKRILVPYASYGTGHRAIANYIKKYFEEQDENIEVMTLDILNYSIPIVGSLSKNVTEYIWRKVPLLWNFIYTVFDNKYSLGIPNKLSTAMFKNKKIRKTIQSFNPDLTISTHFFGSSLIASYKNKNIIKTKLITVVTDYEAHEFWLKSHKSEDAIVVADKLEARLLVRRGFKKKKIKPLGIPICPKIPTEFNKEKSLKKYGFSGDKTVCLFFGGGGNGSKAVLPYIKRILKLKLNIDILFVSGKSKYVKQKVEEYARRYNAKNIKIFGFVTNVPELFGIADFIVSKPGGAQSTESIYFKKPMLSILSTGGQENANYRYFAKKGFGKNFKTAYSLSKYLTEVDNNPNILDDFKKNIEKSDNSHSMEKLYELAVEILKK